MKAYYIWSQAPSLVGLVVSAKRLREEQESMTEHQDMEQRRRKTIAWGVGIAGPLIGGLLIAAGLSIQAILLVLAALALMGILLTLRLPR
ncbi:hypothetical protein JHW40_04630 [Paracoccus alcaliphilus]|nr:hypothetical protein JHW40_04630 [Paracoccus alcaliphilus]